MDNYEHEIACPENKGIRNYLWYDHFISVIIVIILCLSMISGCANCF